MESRSAAKLGVKSPILEQSKHDLMLQISQMKEKLAKKDKVNSLLFSEIQQLKLENGHLRQYINHLAEKDFRFGE